MTLAPTIAPSPLLLLSPHPPPIFPISCFTGKNKKQSCLFLTNFSQVYKKCAVNN